MSEHSTPEQRTEMPTERRMNSLRKEGHLFVSHDSVTVVTLFAGFMMLTLTWDWFFNDLKLVMIQSYSMIGKMPTLNAEFLRYGIISLVKQMGLHFFIFLVVIAAVGIYAVMYQTNWNVKQQKIKWDFLHLHPMRGITRIFSIGNYVQTLKAIFKLGLILPVGYFGLREFAPQMIQLMHTSVDSVMAFSGAGVHKLFWRIMYILIPMAAFDYFWGKHQWLKINKMTKEEVKDEKKAIEGDETTRRRMIAKGLARIYQRIMMSVPKADVVVTNPTHYAVALQYDKATMSAPTVVAKGKGYLALRIREIAAGAKVPVLERKELARSLYASTEVGTEIPRELFRAVAEVLAYVYRLKNPQRYQNVTR